MPNWCENNLEIEGAAEDIAAIATLCRCSERRFDFNGVVPMPIALAITCGSTTDNGFDALYGDWQRVADWLQRGGDLEAVGAEVPASREELIALLEAHPDAFSGVSLAEGRQAQANLETFGHKTWYEWCLDKWGTKWNSGEDLEVDVSETSISVSFDTAWSPPLPVMAALCARFPRIRLTLTYSEPGMGFAGTAVGADGVLIEAADD